VSRSGLLRGEDSQHPMTHGGGGVRTSLYGAGGRRKGLTRGERYANIPNGCLVADAGARVGSGGDQGIGLALLEEGAHLWSSGREEVGQSREASRRSSSGDRNGGSLPDPCGHLPLTFLGESDVSESSPACVSVKAVDHIAIAVWSIEEALVPFRDLLGGEFLMGGEDKRCASMRCSTEWAGEEGLNSRGEIEIWSSADDGMIGPRFDRAPTSRGRDGVSSEDP